MKNKLSLILDSSLDGILGLDIHARHFFVNQKASDMLGFSKEELIGKASHTLWHHTKPDGSFYPEEECPIIGVLKDGSKSRGEDLFWRKDGTSFPVEFIRSPVVEEGIITGAIVSFNDISEKKALEEKNERYELTFKAVQVGIAHVGLDGSWLEVNDSLCELVGYSSEELLKLTFQDITYADDLETNLDYVHQLLDGTLDNYHMGKRYIHKNGAIIWTDVSVVLVRDRFDKPFYFIAVIKDISEVKRLIFELESKKQELENIIRFTPTPMMLYAEDGEILVINDTFKKLSGYSIKDLPTVYAWSKKAVGLKTNLGNVTVNEFFTNNVSDNEGELTITAKSGEELVWVFSLTPLDSTYDGKRVFISSAMDITESRKKDALIVSQSRRIAMGEMTNMIAHQWRQPLAIISMVGNNLKASLELGEEITRAELEESIETLDEETQYLSQVIEEFSSFFKPEKEQEKITLCKIYEKIQFMMQKIFENNHIVLNLKGDCTVEFYTFPNELIQVLVILLINSKDVIKQRNIQNGKIDVECTFTADLLTITVTDNAGGIDTAIIDKLGEPYVTTKNRNADGLGIYMALMSVKQQFGENLTWKNCDDGCCFTIELPLVKQKEK